MLGCRIGSRAFILGVDEKLSFSHSVVHRDNLAMFVGTKMVGGQWRGYSLHHPPPDAPRKGFILSCSNRLASLPQKIGLRAPFVSSYLFG